MDSNAIPITLLGRIYSWLPKIRNEQYVEIEEEIPKNEVELAKKRDILAYNNKKRHTFVNQLDLEDAIAALKKEIRNPGNYVAGTLTASYI